MAGLSFARSGRAREPDRARNKKVKLGVWQLVLARPMASGHLARSGGRPGNAETRFLNGGINMYLYLRILDDELA